MTATTTPRYMTLLELDHHMRQLMALGISENDAYAALENGMDQGLSANDVVALITANEE